MSQELRRRRAALRAELAAIERELGEAATEALDPELRDELALSSEFVTLIDDGGRVVYNARSQPGAPDTVGRPVLDFIAEPYHRHLLDVIERARRLGHPCPGRVDARGARGDAYHLWAVPLPSPVAGATTTLIGFEATQLQRVERALQDERSAVHSFVRGIPDTIIIVDPEHRTIFANRAFGTRLEDMMGVDIATLIPAPRRDLVRGSIDSVFDGGPAVSHEVHLDLSDGRHWYFTRLSPITRDGSVVRVCLVATEVTEQRKRETQLEQEREALRQSEARFRTLVEHAPEALVIVDAANRRFLDVSESACRLFGLDRSELMQHGPIELSPPLQPDGRSSEEAGRAYIERTLREGSAQFEWVHLDSEGREFVCEVHLAALPHEQYRLICGSVFDISNRKRAEHERSLLQKELFQAQKLQAIGQLTGGVAHDFNNLLTVILSHVELLKLDAYSAPKVIEHAKAIIAAAMRAASLTQQLLAFARRQPLKPRRIDLVELMARMQSLLARTLGETIAVETECGRVLWDCEADHTQLENALLNLAINARDAMPAGGTLRISMENRNLRRGDLRAGAPPGRYVAIMVADDGSGMSAGVAAQAFEPFFTTKEVGQGSGMGLSMVYGFVKQSGGHVELDTRPGGGTRVTLYLPAADGSSSESDRPALDSERHGQGELILVVEDEPAVRSTCVQALRHLRYRTADATDATTALRLLAELEDVALVLTDVVLAGGVSGVQLAARIADEHAGVPVAFMSGYARDVVARDGQLPDDVQLLKKPFTQAQLAAAVRAAIDRGSSDPG